MSSLETFEGLWTLEKALNRIPVAPRAPLIGTPRRATQSLVFQANRKVELKGQNRKKVMQQLLTSTARKSATVLPAPRPPTPATPSANSGNGGGGYSGNVASRLGQSSNPGYVSALPIAPKPVVCVITPPVRKSI